MLLSAQPLFYLELNDDALIRDIVSGVYTGAPEMNDIQNLWPFGAFVSALYRILPGVPWFGGILFFLQILCAVLILIHGIRLAGKGRAGIPALLAASAVALFLILPALPHFFFVQYSVTAGMLVATAAFLFITERGGRELFAGVVLTGIAYTIRSELVLLLLPMLFLALLFAYTREVRRSREDNEALPGVKELIMYPFRTDHYRRYGLTFIGIFLALALGFTLNRLGYADTAWNDFVRFFDARTEVYDFTGVPPYEGNEAFYASAGLDREAVSLLENYNFGLDGRIDADAMEKLAAYAKGQLPSTGTRLGRALPAYFYRLHHLGFPEDFTWPQTDAPWNAFLVILYLTEILLAFFSAKNRHLEKGIRLLHTLWFPVLLFVCRSVLWLWLLSGGRDPVRVTHSMIFVELSILAGIVLLRVLDVAERTRAERRTADPAEGAASAAANRQRPDRRLPAGIAIVSALLLVLTGIVYMMPTLRLISAEQQRRAEVNIPFDRLHEYCGSHPAEVFFLDVYSSVAETKLLFSEAEKTGRPDNLDLLGGWAVKSPAWQDKLDAFGMDDVRTGLLQENSFLVATADSDISWLPAWYAARGTQVTVTAEDTVADTFTVYAVREAGR